jgi:electron transfer flavoprotein alpha subunit
MDKKDYKGIWVFAEQREGVIQKVALELVATAKKLAAARGAETTAVLLGSGVTKLADALVAAGADRVLVADHELLARYTTDAYAKVICDLVEERKPEILLVGASYLGRDLGPRVAARLGTGLTADCTGLEIDAESGNLMMTRPAFGGNLMATIECAEHRPQMATVRPGVFEAPKASVAGAAGAAAARPGAVETVKPALAASDLRVSIDKVVKTVKEIADIGEARFIVSGGRGLGCRENFGILEELAGALGGVVGSSRAAVDAGWTDKAQQVGQTGKTVRPQIYIACGISGAIQHLAGMQESDFIIAINKDESAPIMKMADIAVVGDLFKVVPELTAKIKAAKAS